MAAGANADYWVKKITANISRDRDVNAKLRALGWGVVRIWETDILRDPERAALAVIECLKTAPTRWRVRSGVACPLG